MKTYRCESCGLDFDSAHPQVITHPEDLAFLGVSAEDAAAHQIVVCGDCLDTGAKDLTGDDEVLPVDDTLEIMPFVGEEE